MATDATLIWHKGPQRTLHPGAPRVSREMPLHFIKSSYFNHMDHCTVQSSPSWICLELTLWFEFPEKLKQPLIKHKGGQGGIPDKRCHPVVTLAFVYSHVLSHKSSCQKGKRATRQPRTMPRCADTHASHYHSFEKQGVCEHRGVVHAWCQSTQVKYTQIWPKWKKNYIKNTGEKVNWQVCVSCSAWSFKGLFILI